MQQQKKHKTNDSYKLKVGELETPNAASKAELQRIEALTDHINNNILPVLKEKDLHPGKRYILCMAANPSLFPGTIQAYEVKHDDVKYVHYNGKKFIVNQCRLQQYFQQMA